jgi:hypothetical protein
MDLQIITVFLISIIYLSSFHIYFKRNLTRNSTTIVGAANQWSKSRGVHVIVRSLIYIASSSLSFVREI